MSRRIDPWESPTAAGMFFCPACGNGPLSCEEVDFESCDACGGEGLDDEDDVDFLDD